MRVLITGITGMIGSHLAKLYLDQGFPLAGISRSTAQSRHQAERFPWCHYYGDIMDRKFIERVLCEFRPDIIFHLAAQAYNGQSWESEETTYYYNINGSHNLFTAAQQFTPQVIIVPACSSAQYGIVPSNMHPINEDTTPLKPITPYGVSKATMEMIANQFAQNYRMKVIIPRLFIHVGPDHPPATALQSFAMQLAAIKLGIQSAEIKVGNLESSRDFVDVRDGVRALQMIGHSKYSGQIFNICSGSAWSIKDCLNMLIDIAGVKVDVVHDSLRLRPSDEPILIGDPKKIMNLGWKPEIPFHVTLKDIFENWIDRLSRNIINK